MLAEKRKVKHICSVCSCKNHDWYEVYYEDKAILKKVDKTYISWCSKVNNYVFFSKQYD